jgi:hypothetical protein
MERLGSQDDFEESPSERWRVPHAGAKTSVLALLGVALGGSIGAALLISKRLAAELTLTETVGLLLLAALLLSSLGMSRIIYEISRPRGRDHSSL